ncbi:MAG: tRNA glutamyl-Q(34) synthetase GluQRS [Methylovulum sp.]|nr:tRNA glutamyl-Q(34) synthetase GluQRS [Methylovulum sp.]MCF7999424.1 tRNA glutamyl-Q(34) synthetase GluQRS [Methylovulum sp.]
MVQQSPALIGRFAPSPTGPLHLGSLYTALASFLAARSQQGQWLLRIDDLDTPRNCKGSIESILTTLDIYGLHWDRDVFYQSQQLTHYEDALNQLEALNKLYPCVCSRKMLESTRYAGHCRHLSAVPSTAFALRVKTDAQWLSFDDELQGTVRAQADDQGDFIIKRKDQIFAYQFAVVIDDAQQHVNQVVRGCDLLDSTPKQLYLQQLLGLPRPHYLHVPIIIDQQGQKLSKQTLANAVSLKSPAKVLFHLLNLLKQQPPRELEYASTQEVLAWGILHWNPQPLKNLRMMYLPDVLSK